MMFRHLHLKHSAPRLPISSADGDCALSVGNGELVTTSSEISEGTVEGTVTITALPTLGVGDNKIESLDCTMTSILRVAIRRSRTVYSCVRRCLLSAVG